MFYNHVGSFVGFKMLKHNFDLWAYWMLRALDL